MAYKVNYVVAKTSPNLYAAAQQGNLDSTQTTQLEQFSWSVQKNKNFMKMPVDEARKEFFKLETEAQDKIKFLYPNAEYAKEADTFSDHAVGALKTVGKGLASPLIGLFKGLTAWTRVINTPYLMARQAAQGEGLFNKQTFTDAWDGRRVYDNGALDDTIKYFGQERVEVAKGILAGLKPGEIVASSGELDQKMLDALQEAYNEPEKFKQVMDGVKYAQVSPGRDILRMFDTKPTKGNLQQDYIDGTTKNLSGAIDFIYQLAIDPLTYLTFGSSSLLKKGDKLAAVVQKHGTAGVRQIFATEPEVVKLWDNLGGEIKRLKDAPDTAARSVVIRDIKTNFPAYNNDEAIKLLERNEITDAKSALGYFEQVENVPLFLSGRVDGVQYFRNGVATARSQRRLGEGMARWLDKELNFTGRTTKEVAEEGEDAFKTLSTLGKEGELYAENIDDIKKFYKGMSKKEKLAQRFARSPQGGVILLGEDAYKTADNFRTVARQVLPRDLADFVTQKFVASEANDQVVIMRNLYVGIMQRFGLDGHPDGKKLMDEILKSKFGDKEGVSIVSQLEVNPAFADEIGKVGLKFEDDVLKYESSGIIHPFQEAGAIGSLNYIQIAQMAGQIKSKKNLIGAMGGATQLKIADDFVNAWSVLTLFPRLGIRSAIDEAFMFALTAPGREVFDFALRRGHRLGKMATAYTGSRTAEPLRAGLKSWLGGKRVSETLTLAQRAGKRSQIANQEEISNDMVRNLDVAFGTAQDAVMPFRKKSGKKDKLGNVIDEEADLIIEGLAHSAHLLNSATRSMAGAASITGKFEREIVEELIDPNNYDMMLKDLDAVSGRGGQVISTEELADARIFGGRGITAVHFENWIKRFYGNAKALDGKDGKRLFDPATNFLSNNGLETAADFRKAKEEALAAIGIRRNKELIEEIGEDGAKVMKESMVYTIVDPQAVRQFIQMSSRSSELGQRGVTQVDIVVDQVDRILIDMYSAFHGSATKFNSGLLDVIRKRHAALVEEETKSLSPIADKWHTSTKSITFDEFEALTQGFQPKGRMFTSLRIEGLTEDAETVLSKYGNKAFELMDRQVTAAFRQPAVMLGYVRIRKNLMALQKEETSKAIKRAIADLGDNAPGWKVKEATENATEIVVRKYVQIATQQAADTVLKYADNPGIRSNFALAQRNVSRFYRATEDFHRRIYRMRDVPLRVAYRIRLMHLGLDSSGFIHKDTNGDPYVMMPMDNVIFKTVDGTVRTLTGNGAFQQPIFNDFTLKLKLGNPSFSPDAGLPTLSGPISALGVLGMQSILGKVGGTTGDKIADELDTLALGNIGEGMDVVRAVVPASLQRAWLILNKDEKDRQEATAAMQAIAYNASQGNYLDPNATEAEKYEYLKQIRISAHNILVMRGVLGFLSPIAPSMQESIGVPDYLKNVGITGLRAEFYDLVNGVMKTYNGDVQDPYELALATFVGKNPNKLVYTVARDEKQTNTIIQKTKELKDWAIENKKMIDVYGETAFIFGPNVGEFDAGTYAWLEAAEFIKDKSVEQYYTDVLVSKDKQAYYDVGRKERELLAETYSISERRSIIQRSTNQRAALKASNPLLETALTAGGNEVASEEKMLVNMEQILRDVNVNIPKETRVKMMNITAQVREFINLALDTTAREASNFPEVKRARKEQIESLIADLSTGDLMLKEANRAIFRAILNYYSRDTYVAIPKG
jgi:hypothetical protein